jgi:hypothetical protein
VVPSGSEVKVGQFGSGVGGKDTEEKDEFKPSAEADADEETSESEAKVVVNINKYICKRLSQNC